MAAAPICGHRQVGSSGVLTQRNNADSKRRLGVSSGIVSQDVVSVASLVNPISTLDNFDDSEEDTFRLTIPSADVMAAADLYRARGVGQLVVALPGSDEKARNWTCRSSAR